MIFSNIKSEVCRNDKKQHPIESLNKKENIIMSDDRKEQDAKGINRRDLLKAGAVAGIAAAGATLAASRLFAGPSTSGMRSNFAFKKEDTPVILEVAINGSTTKKINPVFRCGRYHYTRAFQQAEQRRQGRRPSLH
jgi:hypothetical protein